MPDVLCIGPLTRICRGIRSNHLPQRSEDCKEKLSVLSADLFARRRADWMSEKLVTLRALIVVVVIGATLSSWTVRADQPQTSCGSASSPHRMRTPLPTKAYGRDFASGGYIEDESIAMVAPLRRDAEELRSAAADLVRQKVK